MQKSPLNLALILTIVLSLVATGISVYQSGRSIWYRVPYKSISPQEEAVVDRTAVDALRHIVQARAALRGKASAIAKYEVSEATRLLDTIRGSLSPAVVKDRIWIARKHLEFEPPKEVLHDFPPIYAALDDIDAYLPTDKAKGHVDKAREHLRKDEKREAERELALADKRLVSIEVEAPLLGAQEYVSLAQHYLDSRSDAKADYALKLAERKTQAVSVIARSPLQHAKRGFWLAIKQYSAGHRAEARMYVEQAKASLEQAAKLGDAKGREEAAKLLAAVAELERKIDKGGKEGEPLIMAALAKSTALAEREAEYLSAGWAKEEEVQPRENALVEAKLHVAYAETYQVTAREPANAVKHIDRSEAYLAKFLTSSTGDAARQKKIGAIEKELENLKLHPEKSGAGVQEWYEAIEMELGDLIERTETGEMVQGAVRSD